MDSYLRRKLANQIARLAAIVVKIWFFPRFGGEGVWRRSEHAHASYPGLFFRPPFMGREERRVQGLD